MQELPVGQLTTKLGGTSGQEEGLTRILDASGTSWSKSVRLPSPLTGNEKKSENFQCKGLKVKVKVAYIF